MNSVRATWLWVVSSMALTPLTIAAAPGDYEFAMADKAALEGRLGDMEAAYSQVLARTPRDLRALNGLATSQAWQGRYDDARDTYRKALRIDANNIEALVGLGHTEAWAGRYVQARAQFQSALAKDPGNFSARKGIAYSNLWQGESELAAGRLPAPELTARLGSTSGGSSGLRSFEASLWTGPSTRVAVRYDNSLGLDNPSISERGADAPGYFGAVQQKLGEQWLIGLEIGQRELLNGDQRIVKLESAYLSSFGAIKVGAQSGRHDAGYKDTLLFGGLNLRIGDRWSLEPVYYRSTIGIADDNEWRTVLHVEYQVNRRWQVGGHLGWGNIDAANQRFSGSTTVAGLWGSVLLADRYSLRLSLREEDSPAASLSVVELGFTYRWLNKKGR